MPELEPDVQRILDVLNSPLLAADEYVKPYVEEKQKWLLTKGLHLFDDDDDGEWKVTKEKVKPC